MKTGNAKIWLAAFALQLSPGVVAAKAVATEPLSAAAVTSPAIPLDDAPPAVGTLIVQWTIGGRRDPIDCGGLGVERLVLSVHSSPTDEEQHEGPCDSFQIALDLSPGSYSGEAILVDRFARPVTLSVPLEQVDIAAGRELIKSIDFPVAAFF